MSQPDDKLQRELLHAADTQRARTADLIDRLIPNHASIDCGGDGTREALIRARDAFRSAERLAAGA